MVGGSVSTPAEAGDIIAVMADEDRRTRALGSSVGYVIVLLGAALFIGACFLPYYGYEFDHGFSSSRASPPTSSATCQLIHRG
jgi:hypothetical protein